MPAADKSAIAKRALKIGRSGHHRESAGVPRILTFAAYRYLMRNVQETAASVIPDKFTATSSGLRHSLKQRHMTMIALGGVIGAGLFVGSGVVIKAAGPAAVFSFPITGLRSVLGRRVRDKSGGAHPAGGS